MGVVNFLTRAGGLGPECEFIFFVIELIIIIKLLYLSNIDYNLNNNKNARLGKRA